MTTRDQAVAAARARLDDGRFLADLERRVAIPTESQEPERKPELRRYLEEEIAPSLTPLGYDCAIFENPDPKGGPFLVASRIEDPALPTLLTYGHGDVVRGIPEQWRQGLDPWRITVEGERWYGRGTADNKGQHSIVMAGLAAVQETRGRLGFNAKLLIEMSEEVGSTGLDAFVAAEKERLKADLLIASDGPRMKPERPDIKLGNRGAVAFDLVVDLREGSRHSGHWGGVLEDPAITLAQAIASITTRKGQILVKDWLPKEIDPRVRAMLKECEVDPGADFPTIDPEWGEPGLSRAEKMYGWTSFIVLAMLSGRPENPVNGVQPNARARCQIRFTADIDCEVLLPALRRHLDAAGFPQVRIEPAGHGRFIAWRTDLDNRWIPFAADSVAKTMGARPIVVPNGSGGLPSDIFGRHLGVPTIWVPHSYAGCKQHGPDEHLLAPIVREGLGIMAGLFWDLGEAKG